jgi:hypothetical protein
MTDLLTKVKEALEGATPGPWEWGEGISDDGSRYAALYAYALTEIMSGLRPDDPDARLIALAPDMARALIAAGELADVCDELMGLFPDQQLHLENTLSAFRAAMEGRIDG